MAAYQTSLAKIKDYRPENDTFAQQLRQYKQQGGAVNGPLTFSNIQEGVDERKTAETFFDDMPISGKSTYAAIGDTVKKVGWEGISTARISGQIKQSIDDFATTSAGQQALRRYRLLEQGGQLSPEATPQKYLAGILASAGFERVGGKSIGGAGAGFSPDGSGGFATSTSRRVLTQFTPVGARSLKGIEFNDQGTIVGDGNSSWVDVLTGDISVREKLDDESITPEQKQQYKAVIELANAQNITHQEAAAKIDTRVEPVYEQFQGKRQKDITNAFMTKNAGFYNNMTVIDENGEEHLATDVFEDAGLLDGKSNFDPDAAKITGVLVDGNIGPDSGIAPKGLAVSVGAENYIFIDRNPSPDEVNAYIMNQLDIKDVAIVPEYVRNYKYPPGTMLVRGADGKAKVVN